MVKDNRVADIDRPSGSVDPCIPGGGLGSLTYLVNLANLVKLVKSAMVESPVIARLLVFEVSLVNHIDNFQHCYIAFCLLLASFP